VAAGGGGGGGGDGQGEDDDVDTSSTAATDHDVAVIHHDLEDDHDVAVIHHDPENDHDVAVIRKTALQLHTHPHKGSASHCFFSSFFFSFLRRCSSRCSSDPYVHHSKHGWTDGWRWAVHSSHTGCLLST